ncbi:MAG: SDR family oxidoreductase [Ruminococcus sp.]|nr:SDR family oxidoreductase [Ruminococcus sp.]
MISLRGKWALVTGASRGIGKLSALQLADEGVNLILHGRQLAHLEEIYKAVTEKGVSAHCVAAELSDLAQVQAMLAEIDALGVPVSVVCNNAAVQIAYRTEYFTTPAEDYDVSFRINTIAPMMICYHFMPKMIEAGFGRIINTTSGIDKEPQQAGYSASKAALDKVTRDLGTTVEGTDVIISLADPGWCRTDLGGPHAPNAPESALPGVIVGAFVNDGKSGRIFHGQRFSGMTLADAVAVAQQEL